MFAVAMLGFAVAWALAAQRRRLDALERLLREHAEGTVPDGGPDHTGIGGLQGQR